MQPTDTIAGLHERLVSQIRGETNRDRRKLANNTYGRIEGDRVIIRQHATDIAEITADTAVYRTGGWFTYTTKERINWYLPNHVHLSSDRGVWYLSRTPGWQRWSRFFDELTLRDSADGIVIDGGPQLDDPDREMRRAIEGYVKLYTDDKLVELVNRARETGTNGDCLYCQLNLGKPGVGDHSDHLLYHVSEGYVMVTLAANAIAEAGYRPEIYLGTLNERSVWQCKVIRRCIRKYMRRHLLNKGLHVYTEAELEAM
jgi:hypothetical protein